MAARNGSIIDFGKLAELVTAKQEADGLTLRQVAEQAKIDPTKLSNLRAGRALAVDNLLLLCDWLNVPVEALRSDGAPPWAIRILEEMSENDAGETAAILIGADEHSRRHEEALAGVKLSHER